MTYNYLRQFPILPPTSFTNENRSFIIPRVFELIYSAKDLKPFAEDLWNESSEELRQSYRKAGFNPQTMTPFAWNEDRRAMLRAELDAYYARLYGLTRGELRYILDPQDVYSPDFPGETFRVLKDNETAKYGEYRTRRLVLEAWDRLESDLGPVDPDRLKSYVSSEPASKKTDHGNTEQSPRQSQSAPSHGKQSVSQQPALNPASKPPASSARFGTSKPRSTQAALFPEDTGSPQPSLFTSTSSAGSKSASSPSSPSKPISAKAPDQKSSINTQPKAEPNQVPSAQEKNKPKAAVSTQGKPDPKSDSSGVNPYPASENLNLFKCSVCGDLKLGFSRSAHEKSHPGKKVEWKKM